MGTSKPAGAVLLLIILCCHVVGSSTRMAFLGAPLHPFHGLTGASARSSTRTPPVMMARPETQALLKSVRKGRSGSPLEIAPSFYIRKPKRYLNSTEELVLIKATKRLKLAVDERKKLALSLERQPTSGEWANAMGMGPGEFEEELHALHQASQTLVRFNSNFIGSIVRKYSWLGAESSDLYQEGVIGYLKAAQLFNETRGCRLNTFAYRIVNQHITTAAAKASTIMSMGDSTLQTLIRVNRLKNKYRREGVEDPDDVVDLLAKELNISRAKATGMEKASRPVVVASNMRQYVDTHRCRLVSESEGTETPVAQLSWIQLRHYLDRALQQLEPTERDVIRMTKGLDDGVRRKPYQVAKMLELRMPELLALEREAMSKLNKALTPILPEILVSLRAADDYERSYSSPFVHLQQAKINSL